MNYFTLFQFYPSNLGGCVVGQPVVCYSKYELPDLEEGPHNVHNKVYTMHYHMHVNMDVCTLVCTVLLYLSGSEKTTL